MVIAYFGFSIARWVSSSNGRRKTDRSSIWVRGREGAVTKTGPHPMRMKIAFLQQLESQPRCGGICPDTLVMQKWLKHEPTDLQLDMERKRRSGNQCRTSRSNDVLWLHFLQLQISLTVVLRMDCRRSSWHPGQQAVAVFNLSIDKRRQQSLSPPWKAKT